MIPLLKKPIPLWILLICLPAALLLGGAIARLSTPDDDSAPNTHNELREQGQSLTSPLLECEVFGDQGLKALRPFKFKVEEYLQQKLDSGAITEGAVYFRDLNNGMWFGINQDIGFHPASLLKVPIMITHLKLAETNPGHLQKRLTYRGNFNITKLQGIEPTRKLEIGQSYTVEDLITRMITLSDNNAAQLLVESIDAKYFNQVMLDLNVNVNPDDHEHMITPHAYSGFLRVLYNASYLNRVLSEKALELLARSEFSEGLRAGLPPGTQVASKFGEWGMGPDLDIVQLHEFGIVYYPNRPYLLGVMTRGQRGGDFTAILREISHMVYTSVDEQVAAARLQK